MSDARGIWGLRLLALALAVSAWFIVSVDKREGLSEKVVEVTVSYPNFQGLIVLDRVQTVRVGVRGPASQVRALNPGAVDVFIDPGKVDKGVFNIPLGPENVFLPPSLEVVSIEPSVVKLELDREVSRLVPVVAQLAGEPSAGAVVQEPVVTPPQAFVRGPASVIEKLEFLETSPVDLTGHALDFDEQAAVLPPDPRVTIVDPLVVVVRVPMQIPQIPSAV